MGTPDERAESCQTLRRVVGRELKVRPPKVTILRPRRVQLDHGQGDRDREHGVAEATSRSVFRSVPSFAGLDMSL